MWVGIFTLLFFPKSEIAYHKLEHFEGGLFRDFFAPAAFFTFRVYSSVDLFFSRWFFSRPDGFVLIFRHLAFP